MAKHHDILKSFRAIIPSFDIAAKEHKELVSQSNVCLFICLNSNFTLLRVLGHVHVDTSMRTSPGFGLRLNALGIKHFIILLIISQHAHLWQCTVQQ